MVVLLKFLVERRRKAGAGLADRRSSGCRRLARRGGGRNGGRGLRSAGRGHRGGAGRQRVQGRLCLTPIGEQRLSPLQLLDGASRIVRAAELGGIGQQRRVQLLPGIREVFEAAEKAVEQTDRFGP